MQVCVAQTLCGNVFQKSQHLVTAMLIDFHHLNLVWLLPSSDNNIIPAKLQQLHLFLRVPFRKFAPYCILIGVWLGGVKHIYIYICTLFWKNTIKHMFKWDWTMSSSFINHFRLTIEHNWENLYILSKNQQTCTSAHHN